MVQLLSITAAQVLSCQLQGGDEKMRTNSSSDHCNSYSYINVMCTDAMFEGGWHLPVHCYFSTDADTFCGGRRGKKSRRLDSKLFVRTSEFPTQAKHVPMYT